MKNSPTIFPMVRFLVKLEKKMQPVELLQSAW